MSWGPHHSDMYVKSMYGAGMHVFAVWGYCIANGYPSGRITLNPELLAHTLGGTVKQVSAAIEYLSSPDPRTSSPAAEGRRLVPDPERGPDAWIIVNFDKYRPERNNPDKRRTQTRDAMRRHRARKAQQQTAPDNGITEDDIPY